LVILSVNPAAKKYVGLTSMTTESSEVEVELVEVESLLDLLQADEKITMKNSNNLNLSKII